MAEKVTRTETTSFFTDERGGPQGLRRNDSSDEPESHVMFMPYTVHSKRQWINRAEVQQRSNVWLPLTFDICGRYGNHQLGVPGYRSC